MSNREAFEKAWINFLDNLTIEQNCAFTIGMTKDINHIKYRIAEPIWQASRAQAIDECMKVCEEASKECWYLHFDSHDRKRACTGFGQAFDENDSLQYGRAQGMEISADLIKQLKEQP